MRDSGEPFSAIENGADNINKNVLETINQSETGKNMIKQEWVMVIDDDRSGSIILGSIISFLIRQTSATFLAFGAGIAASFVATPLVGIPLGLGVFCAVRKVF